MSAVVVDLSPIVPLTEEAFYELCRANPNVKFERTAGAELIVMVASTNTRATSSISTDRP